MDRYRSDVIRELDARAHRDSVRQPKKMAVRLQRSVRTVRRWGSEGPPQVRQLSMYLDGHPQPHRIVAHLRAMAEADVREMTRDELIVEYRRLVLEECDVEAEDRRETLAGTSWLDLAAASERDAAVDIRKAAIEREFAARRVKREEVFHG